jgi:prepilin-type N-terminal cleavage/methylation domain-containing protein
MKHGMTLIEIVLALALLAALGAGLSVWINMTSTLAAQSRHTLDWHQSAEAVMRLVADDLLIGDFTESNLASSFVI